jgi:hypothetical protein
VGRTDKGKKRADYNTTFTINAREDGGEGKKWGCALRSKGRRCGVLVDKIRNEVNQGAVKKGFKERIW